MKTTEYEALRVLDKIPREANIYQLIVAMSEKAHQTDRTRFGLQKTDPIREAFREVLEKPAIPE